MLLFKANYRQNPRMEFEGRKKGKYAGAEKFMEKMKKIQEETKAVLGKVQEDMKKYADRKRAEVKKYKVRDLVMLSTRDLKYQMVRRRMEKLTERFVEPYKVKKIVSMNTVELELPSTIKIHPVVNVSRIHRYVGQVEGQKREQPALVIIEREEECHKLHSAISVRATGHKTPGESSVNITVSVYDTTHLQENPQRIG